MMCRLTAVPKYPATKNKMLLVRYSREEDFLAGIDIHVASVHGQDHNKEELPGNFTLFRPISSYQKNKTAGNQPASPTLRKIETVYSKVFVQSLQDIQA